MAGISFVDEPAGKTECIVTGYSLDSFKSDLIARNVCSISVAHNAQDWFNQIVILGSHFEAYLDLVDKRPEGGKMLHDEAIGNIVPGPVRKTEGGWAD